MLELRSVDDGHMYEVCLEEDGIQRMLFRVLDALSG